MRALLVLACVMLIGRSVPVGAEDWSEAKVIERIKTLGGKVEIAKTARSRIVKVTLVYNDKATDADIELLKHIDNIDSIDLTGTPITDRAMPNIALLPMLRRLDVTEIDLSDKGILSLAKSKSLKELFLGSGSKVSDEAVTKLQASIPGLYVSRS